MKILKVLFLLASVLFLHPANFYLLIYGNLKTTTSETNIIVLRGSEQELTPHVQTPKTTSALNTNVVPTPPNEVVPTQVINVEDREEILLKNTAGYLDELIATLLPQKYLLRRQDPLLAILTIPIETFNPVKNWLQLYTLTSWSELTSHITPSLFYEDEDWANAAAWFNFTTYNVTHRTPNGTPLLVPALAQLQQDYSDYPFFGFANADIMFTFDLLYTLDAIQRAIAKGILGKKVLVVGIRTQVKVNVILKAFRSYPMSDELIRALKLVGRDAHVSAEDYFFWTQEGAFAWADIPQFAIGRLGFDNWFVMHAIEKGIELVDASQTITCIHQSGSDGNAAAGLKDVDKRYNLELVRKRDWSRLNRKDLGTIHNARWRTVWNPARDDIEIVRAPPKPKKPRKKRPKAENPPPPGLTDATKDLHDDGPITMQDPVPNTMQEAAPQ